MMQAKKEMKNFAGFHEKFMVGTWSQVIPGNNKVNSRPNCWLKCVGICFKKETAAAKKNLVKMTHKFRRKRTKTGIFSSDFPTFKTDSKAAEEALHLVDHGL